MLRIILHSEYKILGKPSFFRRRVSCTRSGYHRYLEMPLRRGHVGAVDGGDVLGAAVPHHQFQLGLHYLQYPVDAWLTECSQAPEERASDSYPFGAQRKRFEHIRSAADPAVDKHGNPVPDLIDHFGKRLDGRST